MFKKENQQKRIAEFIETIMQVAQGNFDIQINLSDKNNDMDALAMGINMMIDDLKNNTDLKIQNEKFRLLNSELTKAKEKAEKISTELEIYKNNLENIIKERTQELQEQNIKLQNFNKLFVGREIRIKELKDKIKLLESQTINN